MADSEWNDPLVAKWAAGCHETTVDRILRHINRSSTAADVLLEVSRSWWAGPGTNAGHDARLLRDLIDAELREGRDPEAQLEQLRRHFREPVMPVSRYCRALWDWLDAIVQANEDDEAEKDAGKRGVYVRFKRLTGIARELRVAIEKSNLLARTIYGGERIREEKCPEHKGHWSGLPHPGNDCPHGCGLTGWLPLPETEASHG